MVHLLDLSSLSKAVASLESSLRQEKNEFLRDSVVQRFEYTYELCWKFMARQLEADIGSVETDRLSRRDLFRVAAEKGLIDSPAAWFGFHAARNRTSHMYAEEVAEEVYLVAVSFAPLARDFLSRMEKIHGKSRS